MESFALFNQMLADHPLLIAALVIWSMILKGLALWRAAGLRERNWFIAILVINTLGLLELIYLYRTRKDTVEVVEG